MKKGISRFLGLLVTLVILLALMLPALPASAVDTGVNLVLSPASQNLGVGQTFNLTVQAQCGSLTTDGIDVFLDFDQAHLAVQSAVKGAAFSDELIAPTWDNTAGTFDYSAGDLSGTLPTGTFTVATITFLTKSATSSPALVSFHTNLPRKTMVDLGGDIITGTLSGGSYTIADNTPPIVSSVLPAAAATGVAVTSPIVLTFSKAMNQTATQGAFNLSPSVPGAFSWSTDSKTLTFTPSANLAHSTTYTVSLTTAAQAADGLHLTAVYSTTFSTVLKVNLTLTPASQNLGVGQTFNLIIQAQCGSLTTDGIDVFLDFDPAHLAVQSAVGGAAFNDELKAPTWDNTAGTFDYSSGKLIGTLPTGTFTVATLTFLAKSVTSSPALISFHVDSPRTTMVDLTGTIITGTLSGGSYTIADNIPPTVTAISPAAAATGVAVTSPIVLTFSKAMNQTATQGAFSLSPSVSGAFSWSTDSQTLTFTPAANLAYSTNYHIGLTTAARDTGDHPLAAAYSASFTTLTILSSISVSPSNPAVAKGLTQQFTATPTYSDGSHSPTPVIWSSSDTSKVTIDSLSGLATAVALTGTPVTITATSGTIHGTAAMSVTAAALVSLAVSPSEVILPKGETQQFSFVPTYSDGSQTPIPGVTWSSSDTSKVTIDSAGLATAANVTSTPVTITATSSGVHGTATFTVTPGVLRSLTVNPQSASLPRGRTQQYTVVPTYSDNSHTPVPTVVWSSSDNNTVSINSAGLATAVALTGTPVTITATSGTISGSATISVTAAVLDSLAVSPGSVSKAKGRTQTFTATPTYSDGTHSPQPVITWSSSDTTKVTIDNVTGLATADNITTTPVTITATAGTITGTASMTVTAAELVSLVVSPADVSMPRGLTQSFTVTATYTDGVHSTLPALTWSSSDPAKVTVDSSGLAMALGITSAPVVITAASETISGTAHMSVVSPILASISVSPLSASIAKGRQQQYTVTPTYSDGTQVPLPAITWSTSDNSTVTIDSEGLASADNVTGSPVTITAAAGGKTATATITVISAVLESLSVTPAGINLVDNSTYSFSATATYSDGTHSPLPVITWSSSDTSKVTIDNVSGLATALDNTTAPVIITATSGSIHGSALVTVSSTALTALGVEPPSKILPVGQTQQFSVTPTYDNSTTHDLIPAVTWFSSDPDNVTVSDTGLATALGVTTSAVSIYAESGNTTSDNATATVVPSVSLSLSPSAQNILAGDNFTVAVEAQCGSLTPDGIDIYLDFDPAKLLVQSAAPGTALSSIVTAWGCDNTTGTFGFFTRPPAGALPSGNFTVVTITFLAKSATGSPALVSFHTASPRQTKVEAVGNNITGPLSGGSYAIQPLPAVTVTPGAGATGVAISSPVVLTFNKAMAQTVTRGSFGISPSVTGSFAWSADGKIMTFTPAASLANSTPYTVTLSTSAIDTEGRPLAVALNSTFTTASSSIDGGGGGGGGNNQPSVALSGFKNSASLLINSSGVLQSAATLQTADGKLTLTIGKGTKLKTAANSALTSLAVAPLASPPAAPGGNAIVLAYTFSPEGATFDPALTLTLAYDPGLLPAGVVETSLYIAYFDGTQWQKLTTTVDPVTKTVTAAVSHFSNYALIGTVSQPPSTTTPTPTVTPTPTSVTPTPSNTTAPTVTPTVSVTATSTPAPTQSVSVPAQSVATTTSEAAKSSNTLWWILGIIAVILVVAIIVLVLRRRKN